MNKKLKNGTLTVEDLRKYHLKQQMNRIIDK